jgi:hypothetical protein
MTFKPTTGRRILSDMTFIVLDRNDQLDRCDNEQRANNARGRAACADLRGPVVRAEQAKLGLEFRWLGRRF